MPKNTITKSAESSPQRGCYCKVCTIERGRGILDKWDEDANPINPETTQPKTQMKQKLHLTRIAEVPNGIIHHDHRVDETPLIQLRTTNFTGDGDIGNYYILFTPSGQAILQYVGFPNYYSVTTKKRIEVVASETNFMKKFEDGVIEPKSHQRPFYINLEAYDYLRLDKTIQAIKSLKDYNDCSLKEAKDLIYLALGKAIPATDFTNPLPCEEESNY